MELARQKDQFRLNRGLNTESNEINSLDGYTTDERNYELLVDGSRRRRKGLAEETGGSNKASGQTLVATDAHTSFKWRGVGGDPDKNFIVHQVGNLLFFTNDAETISTTYHADTVDLLAYKVAAATTTAALAGEPCEFAQGRGDLFVTSKYTRPIYIQWDSSADDFTVKPIDLRVRDFDGIDDGLSNQLQPGSITADHRYNLRNRGWIEADITAYNSGQSVYPSKGQVWFKGYRRQTNVSFSDLDGVQTFDDAKLAAEQFGQSSAPQGGLFLDPLNTLYSASTTNEGDEVLISTWTMTGSPLLGGTVTVTTAAVHGRSTSDFVTISGTAFDSSLLGVGHIFGDIDGFWQITVSSTTVFTFVLPANRGGTAFNNQYVQLGQINGNVSLPKSDGSALAVGPTAISYHGARLWYAGIADAQWADTLFFSKVAQRPAAYGICYQEGDPTNPEFNQLSSSDGGAIVIPNLGQVRRLLSVGDQLLVFSSNGVWEVGGGQRGVFTATGYNVRKITEAGANSSRSPLLIGDRAIYTSQRGIFAIGPNEFTRQLEATSLSEQLVQTLWNSIPDARQGVVRTAYDDALNRVYFLYGDAGDNANMYANALVLDIKVGAWYKYVFNTTSSLGVVGIYAITASDSTDSNKKIKFQVQSTNALISCDLDQTDYLDFDGAESPLPYMVTGHDDIGDFQRRKQAPLITVFAKRTETGYTSTGNGFDSINESSSLLTAYWDFTDDSVSGKVGSQNETYRHVRGFVPSGTSDVDGYPVVITRNKIRGRGRALQFRFDGAAGKDSHLLGYSTNYKLTRKV